MEETRPTKTLFLHLHQETEKPREGPAGTRADPESDMQQLSKLRAEANVTAPRCPHPLSCCSCPNLKGQRPNNMLHSCHAGSTTKTLTTCLARSHVWLVFSLACCRPEAGSSFGRIHYPVFTTVLLCLSFKELRVVSLWVPRSSPIQAVYKPWELYSAAPSEWPGAPRASDSLYRFLENKTYP